MALTLCKSPKSCSCKHTRFPLFPFPLFPLCKSPKSLQLQTHSISPFPFSPFSSFSYHSQKPLDKLFFIPKKIRKTEKPENFLFSQYKVRQRGDPKMDRKTPKILLFSQYKMRQRTSSLYSEKNPKNRNTRKFFFFSVQGAAATSGVHTPHGLSRMALPSPPLRGKATGRRACSGMRLARCPQLVAARCPQLVGGCAMVPQRWARVGELIST